MENARNYRLVMTTTDSVEAAKAISRALVSEGLAACCNIIPQIISIYEWNDALDESSEFLLLIKSSEDKLDGLEKRIRELHSYEVPEIICLALESASAPYLNWMQGILGRNP